MYVLTGSGGRIRDDEAGSGKTDAAFTGKAKAGVGEKLAGEADWVMVIFGGEFRLYGVHKCH